MKYNVIKEYNDAPIKYLNIIKGEELKVIKESDPLGDNPNWLFCKVKDNEGWVPKQIVLIKAEKTICTDDYHAKEHNLSIGEVIISIRELNGWVWGTKENILDDFGWATLTCLKEIL